VIEDHNLDADAPVRFVTCDFGGVFVSDAEAEQGAYDFVDCGLEPDEFDLNEANSGTVFRVQRNDGSAYELLGDGSVTEIEPFYEVPQG
jgi:hypothetical protein